MLAEIYLLKLAAAVRAANPNPRLPSRPRHQLGAPPGFRTIANFGDFHRPIKHMRFPAQTRESPHFPASTRPIVKHIFATSRGRIGGLEPPPKMVQQRMGHASIAITMDVYGHLPARRRRCGAGGRRESPDALSPTDPAKWQGDGTA